MREIERKRHSTALTSHENYEVTKTAPMVQSYSSSVYTVTPSVQSVQYVEPQENEISSSVEELKTSTLGTSSADALVQETVSEESSRRPLRVRKKKRPYSPDSTGDSRRSPLLKLGSKKTDGLDTPPPPKPFMCERCKSPYFVNPARAHSSSKTYRPRHVFDPVAQKKLTVCNACRLRLVRPRKERVSNKLLPPTEEEKEQFVKECERFAASLAETLQDADAARLYCPSFVIRQCLCLQNYLSSSGEEENIKRSRSILDLLKTAKRLSVQKEVPPPHPKKGEKTGRLKGALKRRSREFEEFVLETRKYLRLELKLCERAVQRVLMYSNNFLHKQLKSTPDKRARIQHMEEDLIIGGGSSRNNLKPITELSKETCCGDRCVLMALTHSRLLEDWRAMAKRGQRNARRVIAEMLTPSGGSKANCYRFIKMVTGCGHTTIHHVSEQMLRTKGDREPPEHGLKKYWREQSKQGEKPSGSCGTADTNTLAGEDDEVDDEDFIEEEEEEVRLAEVSLPSSEELQTLGPVEAHRRLQQHSQQLALVQERLKRQQQKLVQMRRQRVRPPLVLGCCFGAGETQQAQTTVPVMVPATAPAPLPAQVVHILKVPANPQVIVNMVESQPQPQLQALQPQPAISVLNARGELEPVTSVSVVPSQPLGNVFFLPECETLTMPVQECEATVFTTVAPELEPLQMQVSPQPLTQVQLSSVPVQLIDMPVQFAVQSSVHSTVQPAVQSSVHATVQPAVQSSVHPTVQPAVQSSVHPTVQSSVHSTVQPVVQSSVHPTVQSSVHSTVQPAAQSSVHPTVQPAVQSSIQQTILTSVQPSVQSALQPPVQHVALTQVQLPQSTGESEFLSPQSMVDTSVQTSEQNSNHTRDNNLNQNPDLNIDAVCNQTSVQIFDDVSKQISPQEMVHRSVQTSVQVSPARILLAPCENETPQSQEIILSPLQPLAFEMEVQTTPSETCDHLAHTPVAANVVKVTEENNRFSTGELPHVYYVDNL